MTANEYQKMAGRTLLAEPGFELKNEETMLTWNALGLAGEAGEVADSIKKMIYHRHGLERAKLAVELGDVLWYVAALATNLGLSLEEVMEQNLRKLEARYPDGYSSGASIQRRDAI